MRKITSEIFLPDYYVAYLPSEILQSHMGSNIRILWSETPSISHINYPSPCNIYDNAANDTALIASIPHLFWWSDTQIRKKPVSSRCCSHSIHHLSFVCDECYIYGALFQLFVPLCHCNSAVHVKFEFCLANRYKQQLLCSNRLFFISHLPWGNAMVPGLCVFFRIFILCASAIKLSDNFQLYIPVWISSYC